MTRVIECSPVCCFLRRDAVTITKLYLVCIVDLASPPNGAKLPTPSLGDSVIIRGLPVQLHQLGGSMAFVANSMSQPSRST